MTPEEERYAAKLRQEIAKRPYHPKVYMRGALIHTNLPAILNVQDIFLNFGGTGNMDKAGLEAVLQRWLGRTASGDSDAAA